MTFKSKQNINNKIFNLFKCDFIQTFCFMYSIRILNNMKHTRVLKTNNYCLKRFRNKEALKIVSYFYDKLDKLNVFPIVKKQKINSYDIKK